MPRRIRTRPVDAWRDPELVFRARFADATHVVWLDGGADAATGVSILAAAHPGSPLVTADIAHGTVTTSTPAGPADAHETRVASVFDVLGAELADRVDAAGDVDPLGWFGWFGYELGASLNDVPIATAETPDAAFLFVDRAVVFDHAER